MYANITEDGCLQQQIPADTVHVEAGIKDALYIIIHDRKSGNIHIFSDLDGSVEVVRLNKVDEAVCRLVVQKA